MFNGQNVVDLNKYVKLPWETVKDCISLFSIADNVTRNNLCYYFSHRKSSQSITGEISITPSRFRITDYFDLPKNTLPNQPNEVKDTTFGIFIFNVLITSCAFNNKIQYMNVTMNGKNLGILFDVIGELIINKTLTIDEFGTFVDAINWIGYQTELFMPGVSMNLILPNKKVRELKLKLLKENPQFLTNEPIDTNLVAEYSNKIEKPLLALAKEEISKDSSGRLFEVKKPTFGNNYKNGLVVNGPMMDMKTGKYVINNNAFIEGVTPENFQLLANKAMYASYSRGVNTSKGGTNAKYIGPAMQTVILGPKGSDCGNDYYINYFIEKDNKDSIKFNYALINGKLTLLTDEVIKANIGKTIKLRTPQHCRDKNHICNKCVGDMYYILGIKYAGLASNIPMNASMNKSMKKMHDLTVKTYPVKVSDFMVFSK